MQPLLEMEPFLPVRRRLLFFLRKNGADENILLTLKFFFN